MAEIPIADGSSAYPHLFAPATLRGLRLSNRVLMAPMESNLAAADGRPSAPLIDYYRRRAAGGVGMIIVEYTCVDGPQGLGGAPQLRLDSDDLIESHRHLVEAIHAEGARACLQLFHAGRETHPKYTGGLQPVAASPLPCPLFRQMPRELGETEIEAIVGKFGEAARRAVAAGYDAVEIHGTHGYLPANFLSAASNVRTDRFGGSLANRQRLPVMITRAVRDGAGDAPVIFRLTAEEFVENGTTLAEATDTAQVLVRAGADALHVSTGTHERMDKNVDLVSAPQAWRVPLARRIRQVVDVPVIAVGVIREPAAAEAALAEGSADFIALGRALLADPDWPHKARHGRADQIRPCTSCNWCIQQLTMNAPLGCAENPRVGREGEPALRFSGGGARAAVVGAGPGGIVAALLLQQTGFRVTLFEAGDTLAAGLIASAAAPKKDKYLWYRDYLLGRLAASEVEVRTGQRVTATEIAELAPDVTLLATGSRDRSLPEIPGLSLPHVGSAFDLLTGLETPGDGPFFVYGAGEIGSECAKFLAARGQAVILATRANDRHALIRRALRIYRGELLRQLQAEPLIRIETDCTLTAIDSDGVRVRKGDETHHWSVRRVLLAAGRVSHDPLSQELRALGIEAVPLGDARAVGRIGDAVNEAYRIVRDLARRRGGGGEATVGKAC